MISKIKINIIANYGGAFWTALMGLAFVPLYIKFLGMESYGLIGFSGTLLFLFSILDMPLNATSNREMARRSALKGQEQGTRDLLRTLEIIYWTVAVLAGVTVIGLSSLVARYWLNPEKLSIADVRHAVMIMGLVVVFRFPFGLYQGGLMGLQKQVLVNSVNCFAATFRGLGAVLILWLVNPTIQAFFSWQILASGLETFIMAFCLWRSLPSSASRPRFQKVIVSETWRFAVGMLGITIVSIILTQADKILLSKMLPLEIYGYYMLAWALTGAVTKLVSPISGALFPRFSQLVAEGNTNGLTELYRKSFQFTSVIILPVATVLVLFSYQIILMWTGDPNIAEKASLVTSLLVVGSTFNAIQHIPYVVQLAYGWTSLIFWLNVSLVIVLIPILIFLVNLYGMIGGAIVWGTFGIFYLLVYIEILHRSIMGGQFWMWLVYDSCIPIAGVAALGLACRMIMPADLGSLANDFYMLIVAGLCFIGAALAVPFPRSWMIENVKLHGRKIFLRME